MARISLVILFICFSGSLSAQLNRYVVFFKDKAGSSYSIQAPEQFLSARAIARRTRQAIAITEQDIPVNGAYINGVKQTGAKVYYTSRWENCALIEGTTELLPSIQGLSFVARIEMVAPGGKLSGGRTKQFKNRKESGIAQATLSQLAMLGLDEMHKEDARGTGVFVGVFDSGFQGVNTASAFQHIFSSNRLNDAFDFIGNSRDVFQYDDHGTEVFSVIGAESTSFTGGAPDATFHLYVTEDVTSEYRVEEYNWLFAAEKADSLGVDIIQSSLGYNVFDDSEMNYTKSDLNGVTAVVSRAAASAIARGIVVVSSAGNEGNNSWRLVTPPSDINGILAVGSVTSSLAKSSFSSIGPTADNRIKPDIVALGSGTSVVRPNGSVGTTSGTSVAAPLVTSLVAGLLQKFPDTGVQDIYRAVTETASQAASPDNQLGYGIPNYSVIRNFLTNYKTDEEISIFPNPTADVVKILLKTVDQELTVRVFDLHGRIFYQKSLMITWRNNPTELDFSTLPGGVYLVKVQTKDNFKTEKIIKE